jgi:DNA-binding MarR family transcriptional regulator
MNASVHKVNTSELPRQEDLATLRVLEEIERTPGISQREISRRLGVSLGLANLLVRRMAHKAWIKISSVPGRRLLYAVTPRGMAEKVRKTRDFVRLSFRYYANMRRSLVDQIRGTGRPRPRVVVFGQGELADLVAEAARDAGGTFAGAAEPARRGAADVVVLLARPDKARREAWEKAGLRVIDLT